MKPPAEHSQLPPASESLPSANSRRSFLKQVGKKALFITPGVVTLTAPPLLASHDDSMSGPSCLHLGTQCVDEAECCDAAAICDDYMGNQPFTICCIAMGMSGCTVDADCCEVGGTCSGGMCV